MFFLMGLSTGTRALAGPEEPCPARLPGSEPAGGAGPPGEVLKRRGELHRDGVCTTPSCRTEAKGARAQPPFLVLLIPLLREASQGSIRSN